jgi:glutathione reductase (NADPH)
MISYIAVEIAGVLKGLGADVSMLMRHDRPLRTFDHSVAEALNEEMEAQGVRMIRNCQVRQRL